MRAYLLLTAVERELAELQAHRNRQRLGHPKSELSWSCLKTLLQPHAYHVPLAEMKMDTRKPPSGEDIWNALKEEMVDKSYALPSSTLAPTVYHVYLQQDDFDEIE